MKMLLTGGADYARGIKTLVFSSSAVYGEAASTPIGEECPTAPKSPYARTKAVVEDLLHELHAAEKVLANLDSALLQRSEAPIRVAQLAKIP